MHTGDNVDVRRGLRIAEDSDETKTIAVETRDRIEPLRAEWERLAQLTKANPFLWPGWVEAWWDAFGAGQLQILAAYEDDRLVGVLPLIRSRGTLRSTTNSNTPLFGFLVENESVGEKMAQALFSGGIHRIDLSHLLSDGIGFSPVRAAADAARYRVFAESVQAAPYVVTDNKTLEEYEAGLSRRLRKNLRRQRRQLEEAGQLTLDIFDGTEGLDELLQEGFRVEGSGWKGANGTSINSSPVTRRFWTEVARWAAEHGWLRLAFLRLDGRTLAFDYCLEHNRTHYAIKTGYDPAYEKYSPGKILNYLMVARAFSDGLATYELVGPYAGWKQHWTDEYREQQFLSMFAPTTLGFLNQAAYVGVNSASAYARRLTQSSLFPEHGRRLLKQGHRALDRKRNQ